MASIATLGDTDAAVVKNWRWSHGLPLVMTRITLAERASGINPKAIVAQRLKRLYAIESKLKREHDMALSTMNDIAGCRAVLPSVVFVSDLVDSYKQATSKNPQRGLQFHRDYDYIAAPKDDGYRSVHLVYKYRSTADHLMVYNGLRIEIQIRSHLQHLWAAAVETVSSEIGMQLKHGIGDDAWKRLFVLMGSVFAIRERSPLVPGTPTRRAELIDELRTLCKARRLEDMLEPLAATIYKLPKDQPNIGGFILILDAHEGRTGIRPYFKDEIARAADDLATIEKEIAGDPLRQAVFVSVQKLKDLPKAYPSFFTDIVAFRSEIKKAIA